MVSSRISSSILRSRILFPIRNINNYHHRNTIMTATTRIGTDDPRMSKIVVHNKVVYISGQTDATATDITGQTQNVLAKVDDLLSQAGTSKSNILTASIWLKDINSDFQGMNGVWNAWLDPENKPVRATVEASLARPQLLVEVQVTAATE
mmetsp:Transcript_36604/g.76806  ORF Transcript_36604/g.76806 Transcript_36604/m.76806 type:complete len:150 (+) Transcript_36604:185-634(+)